MAVTYKVTVFNGRIISLIQVGEGDRWTRGKAQQIERVARSIAPKVTGRLANSHVTLPTTGSNQYQKRYRVSALAPYSVYVHEGTGIHGPLGRPVYIGKWMKIPGPNPNPRRVVGKHGTVVMSHKGRTKRPWLQEAANAVLRVT